MEPAEREHDQGGNAIDSQQKTKGNLSSTRSCRNEIIVPAPAYRPWQAEMSPNARAVEAQASPPAPCGESISETFVATMKPPLFQLHDLHLRVSPDFNNFSPDITESRLDRPVSAGFHRANDGTGGNYTVKRALPGSCQRRIPWFIGQA
jgi:hypothetical protein